MKRICAFLILLCLSSLAVAQKVPQGKRTIGATVQFGFLVRSVVKGETLIEPGDVILQVDGRQLNSLKEFEQNKDEATYSVWRKVSDDVTLMDLNTTKKGAVVNLVAIVAGVAPGGPAATAGFQQGDIIIRINGHVFRSAAQFVGDVQLNEEVKLVKASYCDFAKDYEFSLKTIERQ